MRYAEWLENNWRDSTVSDIDEQTRINFKIYLNNERQSAIERIGKHFIKEPNIVIHLTKEAFFSLPTKKDIPGWPDITVVEDWLHKNTVDEWMTFETTVFIFVDEHDAFAFKLRWS